MSTLVTPVTCGTHDSSSTDEQVFMKGKLIRSLNYNFFHRESHNFIWMNWAFTVQRFFGNSMFEYIWWKNVLRNLRKLCGLDLWFSIFPDFKRVRIRFGFFSREIFDFSCIFGRLSEFFVHAQALDSIAYFPPLFMTNQTSSCVRKYVPRC